MAKAKSGRKTEKVRRGFRKIHFGTDEVYLWRYHGYVVEIRTPNDQKWVVPIWEIQGHGSQADWENEHKDCCMDDYCSAYVVRPSFVKSHIDARRKLC